MQLPALIPLVFRLGPGWGCIVTFVNSAFSRLCVGVICVVITGTVIRGQTSGVAGRALAGPLMTSSSQNQPPVPPPGAKPTWTVFNYMEARAIAAKDGDPVAIRALVNEAFIHTVFGHAPAPVRDRVLSAELKYRAGQHRTIESKDLVSVINRALDLVDAPKFAHTTLQQVNLYRLLMRQRIPSLGLSASKSTTLSSGMAPVEAAFVAMNLVTQKMLNPDYQRPADEWVKRTNTWLETPRAVTPARRNLDKWSMPAFVNLDRELTTGSRTTAMFIDQILSSAGF